MKLEELKRLRPASLEIAGKVIDGEAVIINLTNGKYYSLQGAGAIIWEGVQEKLFPRDILARITACFEVDDSTAGSDLAWLFEQLENEELTAECDQEEPCGSLPAPADVKIPYHRPELTCYSDLGELLTLDPPIPGLMDTVKWDEAGL